MTLRRWSPGRRCCRGAAGVLLEDHFFPKWHAVLQHWLAHAPDYDEVTAWYLGWKARA